MQTHLACRFDVPSVPSAYAGAGLRRRSSIRLRIFRNSSLGTATSANWNVTYRPWLTTFAPIFTNFSRSVVRDLCSTPLRQGQRPHEFGEIVGQGVMVESRAGTWAAAETSLGAERFTLIAARNDPAAYKRYM